MSNGRRQYQIVVFASLAVERVVERDSNVARVDDGDIAGEEYGVIEGDSIVGGRDISLNLGRTGCICREAVDSVCATDLSVEAGRSGGDDDQVRCCQGDSIVVDCFEECYVTSSRYRDIVSQPDIVVEQDICSGELVRADVDQIVRVDINRTSDCFHDSVDDDVGRGGTGRERVACQPDVVASLNLRVGAIDINANTVDIANGRRGKQVGPGDHNVATRDQLGIGG